MAKLIFTDVNLDNLSDEKLEAVFTGNGTFITGISQVQETEEGRVYFSLKAGSTERSTMRTLWGTKDEEGNIQWERPLLSPKMVERIMNSAMDVGSKLSVTSYDIEPEEFKDERSGETRVARNVRVVQFSDETAAQTVRAYGRTLLVETDAAPVLDDVISA